MSVVQQSLSESDLQQQREDNLCEAFKRGWQQFVVDFAHHIGVKDLTRLLGEGFKLMALQLSQDCKIVTRDCHLLAPNLTFRHVLGEQCFMASCHFRTLPPPTLTKMLRVFRAIVHLDADRPDSKTPPNVEAEWQAFVDNRSPHRHSPFIQTKYSVLGMTQAALRAVTHPEATVALAAFRLLADLLSQGHRVAQETAYLELSSDNEGTFIATCEKIFDAGHIAIAGYVEAVEVCETEALIASATGGVGGQSTRRSSRAASNGGQSTRRSSRAASNGQSEAGKARPALLKNSLLFESLRALEFLCAGHFEQMQNFMFTQNSDQPRNIVSCVVELFEACEAALARTLSSNYGDVGVLAVLCARVLAACAEGPCHVNQTYLANSKFMPTTDRFLTSLGLIAKQHKTEPDSESLAQRLSTPCPVLTDDFPELATILDIKVALASSILTVLLAMLESCHAPDIPVQMMEAIAFSKVTILTTELFELMVFEEKLNNDDNDLSKHSKRILTLLQSSGPVSVAHRCLSKVSRDLLHDSFFQCYTLLASLSSWRLDKPGRQLNDAHIDAMTAIQRLPSDVKNFANTNVKCIEILRETQGVVRIEKIFFELPSVLQVQMQDSLWKSKSEKELFNVPRENPREKSIHFLARASAKISELFVLRRIRQSPALSLMPRIGWSFAYINAISALIITLMLFVEWGPSHEHYANTSTYAAQQGLAAVNGVSSLMFALNYFIMQGAPLVAVRKEKAVKRREKLLRIAAGGTDSRPGSQVSIARQAVKSGRNAHSLVLDRPEEPFRLGCFQSLFYEVFLLFTGSGELPINMKFSAPPPILNLLSLFFCLPVLPLYHVLHMSAAYLGVYSSPWWFTVHLWDYLRLPGGQLVMSSIVLGGPNLLKTFVLGAVVLLSYAVLAFVFFSHAILEDQCETAFQCIGTMMA
jgi:hypothetical protein